jgi:hypothetical protein
MTKLFEKRTTNKKPYICSECNEPCKEVVRDFGIGKYEYWGSMCSDHDYQEVSHCCDAECLDEDEWLERMEEERLEKEHGE